MPRWQMFFDSLSTSLATGEPPKRIDWYAFGDRWDHSQRQFTAAPQGDTYAAALAIAHELHLAPDDTPILPTVVAPRRKILKAPASLPKLHGDVYLVI